MSTYGRSEYGTAGEQTKEEMQSRMHSRQAQYL